ncbi:MAG TPA: 1,4-dihydroxy-2-naphthoate octaprenyltransferase [Anaeromyxobacter sp.]|nr:1,4-dihydroxy-2-naphthoate octaprenyltransferase [Anaeromyxobacter sp.]
MTAPALGSRTFGPWFLAARVKTLPAALVPVAVGTALASRRGQVRPGLVACCACFALLVQVATNMANDLYDAERGADTPARRGPTRVTAAGLVTPRAMRRALLLVNGAAVLLGLPVLLARGPVMIPVGGLALLAGWAYTGGPFPLAYHGLGDAFVVLFFGLVAVAGTCYGLSGTLDAGVVLAGLGVGLICDNLLVVNNARDVETDAAVGKRTLLVRLGQRFGRMQYLVQAAAGFALPFALGARVGAITLLASPISALAGRKLRRARQGRDFNRALGLAAAALLAYGVVLSVSLAPGR